MLFRSSKFLIKGINLSNWLMPEGYMFKFKVSDSPRQIFAAFDRLLGPERARLFWQEFRDNYIGRADIRFIKSVGFNTVRIPLHYALFMTADGTIAGEGWVMLVDERKDLVEDRLPLGLGAQAVEHPAAVGESLHQAGVGQQLEVSRHPRLALAQDAGQLQHRQFLAPQQRQDPQPRRLSRRPQYLHRLIRRHRHVHIRKSL